MKKENNRLFSIIKSPRLAFVIFGLILIGILFIQLNTKLIKFGFVSALCLTLCYAIVAIGFSYLLGYAGLASLGTAGFVALGAYITIFLLKSFTGLNYFLVLLLVLAVAIGLGFLVGFISLRIEGIFLAIVTLGLSEVLYQVFVNAHEITGGTNGLSFRGLINVFPGVNLDRTGVYIMIVIFLVIMMILTYNLTHGPTGRAMLAMKNSTSVAQAMGISLLKYRLLAFILATLYAAIGGSLFALFTKYTDPKSWTIMFSLNILACCLLGGSRSIWGILTGTFLTMGMSPMFFTDVKFLRDSPWVMQTIIGVILILVLLFYRGGVTQMVQGLKTKLKKLLNRKEKANEQ